MLDENIFRDKRFLVTGASSGIGRSTAILLSQLGASVILIGRDEGKLQETLEQMVSGEHHVYAFELRDFDGYDTLFRNCTENGKLDGMVHCAGIAKATPTKALSIAAIREIMDTNFISFMMLVKNFSKKRFSNDGASIVAVSAINVHYPQKCMSVYAASKGALEASVRTLSLELHERKIRINTIVAGPVVSPMSGFAPDSFEAVGSMSEVTPNLMGMAHPKEIANMAAFLLSSASGYTTGRNFYADGGRL